MKNQEEGNLSITNLEIVTERYNNLSEQINNYISSREINIKRLKLQIERLTDERESLSLDEKSREDIVAEYNERILNTQNELQRILEPSKEDRTRILDEITSHNQKIEQEKRKIDEIITKVEERQLDINYEISKWHYARKPLDAEYYKILNESQKFAGLLSNLIATKAKYDELKKELKEYENSVFEKYYADINEIYNERETQIENIVSQDNNEVQNLDEISKSVSSEDNIKEQQYNNEDKSLDGIIKNVDVEDDIKEQKNEENSANIIQTENINYEYELDEETTMQNYRNSGYGQNAYGWYFDPYADEFDKDFNPLNCDLFRAFKVYEISKVVDEEATMQNYRNSGYSQNAYGWYFDPYTNDFTEDFDPLKCDLFIEYKEVRNFVGIKNETELRDNKGKIVEPQKPSAEIIETNDDTTETIDDTTEKTEEDENKYTIEEAIEKIKDELIYANEKDKEFLLNTLEQLIRIMYEREQKVFEEELKNTIGVKQKIEFITKRIEQINLYKNIFVHANPDAQAILESVKENILKKIDIDYNYRKNNGEYCWKEYELIKESIEYIEQNIQANGKLSTEFERLLFEMNDLIKNPNQDKYDEWKRNITSFTNENNLDSSKICPYLTAKAKQINIEMSVDKEYNINGLNLKKIEEITNTKPRRKVTAVSKALKWIKEHKLISISVGLGLLGVGLYLFPPTHMMINSALWWAGSKLGFSSTSLATLNSINKAVAKTVKGGAYVFEPFSGAYTLGGKVGAKTLYTAGAAKLVGALDGLFLGGSITAGAAATIKAIANKIKKKRDKKLEENIENKNVEAIENQEELEETENIGIKK